MKKILFSVILAAGVQTVGAQNFVGAQNLVPLQAQTIIFVKSDGTGDGSSWAQACNLEHAVGNKSAVGVGFTPTPSQIWVQTGTYYPSAMLIIPDSVKMYGGFSGTETDVSQRDFAANPTIIDAQNKFGSVVRLSPFAELNGFTIQNGVSQRSPHKNGGGVWMDDFSTVENCTIINNSASLNGGGIYAKGAVNVKNCTIENNTAGHLGHNVYGCCMTIEGGSGIAPFICNKISSVDYAYSPGGDLFAFKPLAVSAVGSSELSYQWYSNTTKSTIGGTPVGTNSPSYTPSFTSISALYYYVIVSNAYGKDTSNISGLYTVKPLNFDYKGAPQEFTLYPGTYVIECWGAQGYGNAAGNSGKGGYTKGVISLTTVTTFYVFVGATGMGKSANTTTFNGGTGTNNGCPGGGASDIRVTSGAWNNVASLRSRIMVAGGGGSSHSGVGGSGGGLNGLPGRNTNNSGSIVTPAQGGSQTKGGATMSGNTYPASGFGFGGGGDGGGGGYYGGGGADGAAGGGGGSSFISGHAGCNAINASGTHTGQPNHYSGMVFTETVTIAGNASMPNPRGAGNITGNTGNGFVRITRK